jgi:hypothetical protein
MVVIVGASSLSSTHSSTRRPGRATSPCGSEPQALSVVFRFCVARGRCDGVAGQPLSGSVGQKGWSAAVSQGSRDVCWTRGSSHVALSHKVTPQDGAEAARGRRRFGADSARSWHRVGAKCGCSSVTMARCPRPHRGTTRDSFVRSDGLMTSRSRSPRCAGGWGRGRRSSGCRDQATSMSAESSSVSARVPQSCARSGTRSSRASSPGWRPIRSTSRFAMRKCSPAIVSALGGQHRVERRGNGVCGSEPQAPLRDYRPGCRQFWMGQAEDRARSQPIVALSHLRGRLYGLISSGLWTPRGRLRSSSGSRLRGLRNSASGSPASCCSDS